MKSLRFVYIPFLLLLVSIHLSYALKGWERDLAKIYKQASPSVVSVTTTTISRNMFWDPVAQKGSGSGVLIDAQGHILTNYHVIEGAAKIQISFDNPDKLYPAMLVGKAPKHDLAIIRVKAPKKLLVPAKLGDSDNLTVGQAAIAIGNPFGNLGRTMTTGIVSAINRNIEIGGKKLYNLIQTDAAINPGNSGGALINSDGEVIGINTLIFSQSGGSVGVGFATPINTAINLLPDLISKGHVDYPLLGVSCLPLYPELAEYLKLPVAEGLLVLSVVHKSGAHRGGIRGGTGRMVIGDYIVPVGGDILLMIDKQKLKTTDDLTRYLQTKKRVGDKVKVTLIRDGKRKERSVTLSSM